MNSKPISPAIDHRKFWTSSLRVLLILSFFTLPSMAQDTSQNRFQGRNDFQERGTAIKAIEGLTMEELIFIARQPLTPQYEDTPYQGPDIKPKRSYSKKLYLRSNIATNKDILNKRVELAISYREQGDIDQFNNILLDVIARNNYNEEAAWAALLLGDFELLLYNLEEAKKFYIYIVNVHYHSQFGLEGMYKLAITLDRMANWSKAEELCKAILERAEDIEENGDDNFIKQQTRNYLKRRYLEQSRWYLEQKNDSLVKEYFLKYKELIQ